MTTALKDIFDLTEFSFVDPDEVHLVGRAANGFESPLLAKAAAEINEQLIKGLSDQFIENYCYNTECSVCAQRFEALYKADPTFVEKAKLKAKDRKALPDSAFALPEKREYPIHDENHARAALSMLHNASPEDQKRIKAAVHRRYPNIGDDNVKDDDAKKDTASTAASEVQTHAVDPGPEGPSSSPDPGDGGTPHAPAVGSAGSTSDGEGDTAPDKDLHQSEAETQTHGNVEGNPAAKSEVAMTGDAAEDKDEHPEGAAKDTPGSPEWEQRDVALGEKAQALASELHEVVTTFTEREKAEGGVTAKEQRIVSSVTKLLENPALLKEVAETMSASDVLKTLGEQDSARRSEDEASQAAFDAAVQKAAKKLAKKEARKAAEREQAAADAAATGSEGGETAKAAEDGAEAEDLTKLSPEELIKRIGALEETVKEIGEQDGKRPFVSGAGAAAMLRGPEAESIFKALDERVDAARERLAKATTDIARSSAEAELQSALQQRFTAKMVARGNAQARGQIPAGRFGPQSTELFKAESIHSLPDDTGLQYVGR